MQTPYFGHHMAQHSQALAEKIMESLPDAVLVLGDDGRILDANRKRPGGNSIWRMLLPGLPRA